MANPRTIIIYEIWETTPSYWGKLRYARYTHTHADRHREPSILANHAKYVGLLLKTAIREISAMSILSRTNGQQQRAWWYIIMTADWQSVGMWVDPQPGSIGGLCISGPLKHEEQPGLVKIHSHGTGTEYVVWITRNGKYLPSGNTEPP